MGTVALGVAGEAGAARRVGTAAGVRASRSLNPPKPATAPAAVPGLDDLRRVAPDLDVQTLADALSAMGCARGPRIGKGRSAHDSILAVIDYSLPSTEKRLWVLDLEKPALLFHELVAHGIGSGETLATRFSNENGTRASSLGLYHAAEVYEGRNGYSLRLDGLTPGVNNRARERDIVMHGAWYVSPEHARKFGRLGRSWGCPALDTAVARPVIDTLRDGAWLFIGARAVEREKSEVAAALCARSR